ncbi:MAG: enoyl-CoA hydratase-related protein [Congregibacter sp.]
MNTEVQNEILRCERRDGVAEVTLNRPGAMNALSPALLSALTRCFRELQADAGIRAAILTGAGRAFCAGLDLKVMAATEGASLDAFAIHGDNDVCAALGAFDRPLIVAVNGVAATGGFELALTGDVLVAGESAGFTDTHCRVGLAPGWGLSQKLARIIGPSRAMEAHFSSRMITAQQASQWGLVSRVVPDEALMDDVRGLARDIAANVSHTVKTYKRLVHEGLSGTLHAGLTLERHVMAHANQSVGGDTLSARQPLQRGSNAVDAEAS